MRTYADASQVSREEPSKPMFWEPYYNSRSNTRGWFNTVTRAFSKAPPQVGDVLCCVGVSRVFCCRCRRMLADDMGLGTYADVC